MIKRVKNFNLKKLNTFRMDVSAGEFIEYDSVADLLDIDFDTLPKPVISLGKGSNLLFTKDFPGTVLHSDIDFIYELPEDSRLYEGMPDGTVLVSAGAGVEMDRLCGWAADKGLWGIENLSHIPGDAGAAAVQNIGAYGTEFADVAVNINCYDIEEEEFTHFTAEECGYAYRDSVFKHPGFKGRYIVTNVIIALSENKGPVLGYGQVKEAVGQASMGRPVTPGIVRKVITEIRKAKLPEPSVTGSAGSFFKNPVISIEQFNAIRKKSCCEVPHYILEDVVKIPAAWLIDQCGWKGRTHGNAGVHSGQPLVLINATGKARPEELIELKDLIIASVNERFGIQLIPEVEII
ncbi:MAG: UDP-N-acetylmuramate dehydrogenase [Bacteroidales bacterium]|nr:UDP-N-acetylmuramate dehydrogenase [Bacteroidales bacterium]